MPVLLISTMLFIGMLITKPSSAQNLPFSAYSNSTLQLLRLDQTSTPDDYLEYYELCNQADEFFERKDYTTALKFYNKANNTVNFVHTRTLKKVFKCALELAEYEIAVETGKQIVLQSGKLDFYDDRSRRKFKKKSQYQILYEATPSLILKYNKSVNHSFIREIDSLYYVDQKLVRHDKSLKGNYKIDVNDLPENRFELDSKNFAYLLQLIDKYGFPSEQLVGPEANEKVWYVIHHNVRMPDRSHFFPEVARQVIKGHYSPEFLAWSFDQYLSNGLKQQPVFFYKTGNVTELTENEKQIVNENRKAIGLPNLDI